MLKPMIHICLLSAEGEQLREAVSSEHVRYTTWPANYTEWVRVLEKTNPKRQMTQQDMDAKNIHPRRASAHSSKDRIYLTGTDQDMANIYRSLNKLTILYYINELTLCL